MKTLLCCAVTVLWLTACSSDPLDKKYTEEEGMKPILEAKPPLDRDVIRWIWEAKTANEKNGVSNQDLTFHQLSAQGLKIVSERRVQVRMDSLFEHFEAARK